MYKTFFCKTSITNGQFFKIQQGFFLNANDVASFMIFVFTEDIIYGLYHPTLFSSWIEVLKYVHHESTIRKKKGNYFLWETDAESIDQRVDMWLTVHGNKI